MAVRSILLWPDRRLTTPADPVGGIDEAVREIWRDMIETMEAMPGVGLAAPQIGVMRALAVVDASEERGKAIVMANPQILEASTDTKPWDEASPCLPGVFARVTRPTKVRVAWTDDTGQRVRGEFDGLWAVSVQHQIDHLAGRVFIDRLSRTRREILLKKYRKARA